MEDIINSPITGILGFIFNGLFVFGPAVFILFIMWKIWKLHKENVRYIEDLDDDLVEHVNKVTKE